MFGALKPVYNKLNSSEKEFYKMYYCGLCSSLGRLGGPVLRMGLSYDVAFMYMMLDLGNEKEIKKCFCPGRVLKKRKCIDNKLLSDYMAAVSVVLIHGKCIDNIADNEKIVQSKIILHLLKRNLLKLEHDNDTIINLTQEILGEISELEKNFENSNFIDIADKFGVLTGKLFEFAPCIKEPELYYKLGYWIGRWIYIVDAALDISEDKKKSRFNPFIKQKRISLKETVKLYESEITNELFKAHDCVVDILKLIETHENSNEIINIVSFAMDAAEGNIFRMYEGIKNAK